MIIEQEQHNTEHLIIQVMNGVFYLVLLTSFVLVPSIYYIGYVVKEMKLLELFVMLQVEQ